MLALLLLCRLKGKNKTMGDDKSVPVVDLSSWLEAATPRDLSLITQAQRQTSTDVQKALTSVGGFIVKNHGIHADHVYQNCFC